MRAQAGLDVRHGDVQLGRSQRTGERGVGVAIDQHPIGLFLLNQRFDTFEHAPGHRTMAEASDAKVVVRARDVELIKENVRHVGVEVLASVDDDLLNTIACFDGSADGGSLDELRPRAEDGEDFQMLLPCIAVVFFMSLFGCFGEEDVTLPESQQVQTCGSHARSESRFWPLPVQTPVLPRCAGTPAYAGR